jgi:hypothetical protein
VSGIAQAGLIITRLKVCTCILRNAFKRLVSGPAERKQKMPPDCQRPVWRSCRWRFHGRIDCLCGLAIILAEQVGVSPQRDVGLGVAEAPANGHDVDIGIDELTGITVPQDVEGHAPVADTLGKFALRLSHRLRRKCESRLSFPSD